MRAIGEVARELFGELGIKQAGEKTCEKCNVAYPIYESPKGVIGFCKPCEDQKFVKSLNLPTVEEFREGKANRFAEQFERVPHDLRQATVNSYTPSDKSQTEAKDAAVKFVNQFSDNKHGSFVLSGTPGLGKSHLAYAISKAIKAQGYKVLYLKSTDLLDHIRKSYGNQSGYSEEQVFEMISNLDLLVLDDIGSEYVKRTESGHESWASDVLYKVFDSRLNKATVCTTNYSERELQEKYGNNGPRIISRMLDTAVAMRIKGDDFRRKKEAF